MKKGDQFRQIFILDNEIYMGFRSIFKDENPLHVNKDFSQKKGFRDRVMHGNILGGFLSNFIGECLPVKNVIIHSQEIKYLNPVYLNDHLELIAIIDEVFDSVKVIEFKFHFINKGQQKIAKGRIHIGII